jgi:hypothetical protein
MLLYGLFGSGTAGEGGGYAIAGVTTEGGAEVQAGLLPLQAVAYLNDVSSEGGAVTAGCADRGAAMRR